MMKDARLPGPLLFLSMLSLTGLALLASCHGPAGSAAFSGTRDTGAVQKITALTPAIQVLLNPGSEANVADSSARITVVRIDGDCIFHLSGASVVLLQTGMLNLYGNKALFRVQAHRASPGQSVEVLRGSLTAEKAYPSAFPDTETLRAGGMVMINTDIDLMEKEVFDTAALAERVKGTFSFHDIPLAALVKKLEDWYGVDIRVSGETRRRFSGNFDRPDLRTVLDALSRQAGFRYRIDGYRVALTFP